MDGVEVVVPHDEYPAAMLDEARVALDGALEPPPESPTLGAREGGRPGNREVHAVLSLKRSQQLAGSRIRPPTPDNRHMSDTNRDVPGWRDGSPGHRRGF